MQTTRPFTSPEPIWDAHCRWLWRSGETPPGDWLAPHSEALNLTSALSVEAWVHCDADRPEAMQALVSKWSPLTTFDAFSGYDAGQTDGLPSVGYFGAVFDGRYVYCAPEHYKDRAAHGIVLRYDTHSPFRDAGSYAAYDAGQVDGLNTRGFYGAAFDGQYVYFVPRQDSTVYHSRVLRFNTNQDFKDPASWEAYDVGEAHSQQGAAFDGRYLYFAPGFAGDPRKEDTLSARVIRCDTQGPFKDPASWRSFDASGVGGLQVGCFDGAGFDGRYIYFAPIANGVVLRYDTQAAFDDRQSWSAYAGQPSGMGTCVGIVFDGRFLYFVPYAHGVVVRYDTAGDFTDAESWRSYDALHTSGLIAGGFDGGFFDGRFVYFVPFVGEPSTIRADGRKNYTFHTNFLRYDTQGEFGEPASWQAHDAGLTDGLKTVGYNAGAFDGRYFYLAPWQDGAQPEPMHGRMLRYDTLGSQGSFSLRYCDYGHNGGLCAAVPGPSFLVNTQNGALSVAAHRPLAPGRHHLAGVYDGRAIRLYIDGALAAERAGSGELHLNDSPLAIGRIHNGGGRFLGTIEAVRISDVARGEL